MILKSFNRLQLLNFYNNNEIIANMERKNI